MLVVWGLLAKFSKPSALGFSVSLSLFFLAFFNSLLSFDFFFFAQLCDVWEEFLLSGLEGKERDLQRGGHLLDLSKGGWIEGINKRGCWCFGPSAYVLSSQGSQTRRRRTKDEEKETKAERKWESDWGGGGEKRISYPILSPVGKGGWEVTVEDSVWHGRRSTTRGGEPPVQPSSSNNRTGWGTKAG